MADMQEQSPEESVFALLRKLSDLRESVSKQSGLDARQGVENRKITFALTRRWGLEEGEVLLATLNELDRSFLRGDCDSEREATRGRCLQAIAAAERRAKKLLS